MPSTKVIILSWNSVSVTGYFRIIQKSICGEPIILLMLIKKKLGEI